MNFIEQLSAVALLIDFLLGVAFGVVGGVACGSARDDRPRVIGIFFVAGIGVGLLAVIAAPRLGRWQRGRR